jgi:hypothetical protein
VAQAGKLVGGQIIGAIKNIRFQSSLVHKTDFYSCLKNQLSRPARPGVAAGLRWHAVASPHMLHIFLTIG